jgi:hypothetical protein
VFGSFNDAVFAHFDNHLHWLASLLLCGGLRGPPFSSAARALTPAELLGQRESEGPIYEPQAPSPLRDLLAALEHPRFFVVLSQTCLALHADQIDAAVKNLKRTIPAATGATGSAAAAAAAAAVAGGKGARAPSKPKPPTAALDQSVVRVLERVRENAHLLLQRYAAEYGGKLSRPLRAAALYSDSESAAGEVATAAPAPQGYVLFLQVSIEALDREVADLFPGGAAAKAPGVAAASGAAAPAAAAPAAPAPVSPQVPRQLSAADAIMANIEAALGKAALGEMSGWPARADTHALPLPRLPRLTPTLSSRAQTRVEREARRPDCGFADSTSPSSGTWSGE